MNELRRLLEMGLDPRNYGYNQDPMTGEFIEPQPNELASMIQQAGGNDVLSARQAFDMSGNPEPTVNGDFQVYAGEGRPNRIDLNPVIAQIQKEQAPRQMRQAVMGTDGIFEDRGQFQGTPEIDYSRPGIEIAGKGKGLYTKDGDVVIQTRNGPQLVRMNVDRQATAASAKAAFDRLRAEQGMKKADLDMERTRAEIASVRAPKPEKAPPGYRFKPDGSLEAIAGGPAATKQAEKSDQVQGVVESAADTIRKLDEMIGQRDASGKLAQGAKPHEGFEDAVGATWKPFARFIPGTDASDFQSRLDEIKGGAFLKAFETLKGGGQITQIEGEKATAAITRMGTAQSEAEFVKAAQEFREVVRRGMERAQRQQWPQGQTIKGGFRYLGTEG